MAEGKLEIRCDRCHKPITKPAGGGPMSIEDDEENETYMKFENQETKNFFYGAVVFTIFSMLFYGFAVMGVQDNDLDIENFRREYRAYTVTVNEKFDKLERDIKMFEGKR